MKLTTLCAATVLSCALASIHSSAQTGLASVYNSGYKTASGAHFNPRALTAAHRTLPLGSRAKVTNLANSHSITVTINDRGPFVRGRIIDLTPAAASALGIHGIGHVRVASR